MEYPPARDMNRLIIWEFKLYRSMGLPPLKALRLACERVKFANNLIDKLDKKRS